MKNIAANKVQARLAHLNLKKRERTQNWSLDEKNRLFQIITDFQGIVESRDAQPREKNNAWRQISDIFNKEFTTERKVSRIKEQWRRMKSHSKMEIFSFANTVRSVSWNEALKSPPMPLAISIWNHLEGGKKRSKWGTVEHRQEKNLRAIVKQLVEFDIPDDPIHNVKVENTCDGSEEDRQETVDSYFACDEPNEDNQSLPDEDDVMHYNTNKKTKLNDSVNGDVIKEIPNNIEAHYSPGSEKNDAHSRSLEILGKISSTHAEEVLKEHALKVKVLKTDLERAEIQKLAALHELRASEIRKEMAEAQSKEYLSQVKMCPGEPGSGAGRGGGGGGSIRSAGGSFGKMEAAHEDQYFYNLQKEQLKKLHEGLHDEISFHEEQIKRHQEAISRHKKRINDMNKD